MGYLRDIINAITHYIIFKGPMDFIRTAVDIGVVSYGIYRLIKLVRETRAAQLIKGILVIIIAMLLSEWLQLKTTHLILQTTLSYGVIALIIVFQPELRRALEQIGRSKLKNMLFNFDEEDMEVETTETIEEVVNAASSMSKTYTGALMVFERETKIGEIIKTGVYMEAHVTSELLVNIFSPNTPLHDGAVVIRDSKIMAAGCFLPLTDNQDLSKELGTRHRAALGITENSDSIVVVVSEESGKISFAHEGGLTRNLNSETLRKALVKTLVEKKGKKKISLWKVKNK